MNSRIGLFTPKTRTYKKKGVSTNVTYIEAKAVSDVVSALGGLGAKRVGLFWRDRVGAGHLEGELFPVADLGDEHLKWVAGKTEEFQMRGLFYDLK